MNISSNLEELLVKFHLIDFFKNCFKKINYYCLHSSFLFPKFNEKNFFPQFIYRKNYPQVDYLKKYHQINLNRNSF